MKTFDKEKNSRESCCFHNIHQSGKPSLIRKWRKEKKWVLPFPCFIERGITDMYDLIVLANALMIVNVVVAIAFTIIIVVGFMHDDRR